MKPQPGTPPETEGTLLPVVITPAGPAVTEAVDAYEEAADRAAEPPPESGQIEIALGRVRVW